MTFKSIIILSCFIANMEQDIFLDMFFAFFFAVSENLFTFAAIKGSHWRNLPKVLSRVAVFRDAATFVRKADFRARQLHSSLWRRGDRNLCALFRFSSVKVWAFGINYLPLWR